MYILRVAALLGVFLVSTPLFAEGPLERSIRDEIESMPNWEQLVRCSAWFEASSVWIQSEENDEQRVWARKMAEFGYFLNSRDGGDGRFPSDEALVAYTILYLSQIQSNLKVHETVIVDEGIIEQDINFCLRLANSTVAND